MSTGRYTSTKVPKINLLSFTWNQVSSGSTESINPNHQIILEGRESTNHHRAPSPNGLWYEGCSQLKAEPLF